MINQILKRTIKSSFRSYSTSRFLLNGIKNVTVIGGGTMGIGIVQEVASFGYSVSIVDRDQKTLEKTLSGIHTSLKRVVKKKFEKDPKSGEIYIEEILNRIKPTVSIDEAAINSDLIIETIFECIDEKQKLFKQLDKIAPNKAIFTSNTSSLSIEEIAKPVSRKDRFGGLHFFNPVPVMKLLEVIRIPTTSDSTFNSLLEFGKSIGKTTVSCKDTPGFIVNRLLIPYMAESLKLYERGDASFKDIDVAMKLGAGYTIGPFELFDHIGLDTCKFIFDGWHKRYTNHPTFKPNKILDNLVETNKHGRKTRHGFYTYNEKH